MSYLSMRMREEGFWGRPKASEEPINPLTVTVTVDTSQFDRSIARAMALLGLTLEPWQEALLEEVYARQPDGRWRHRFDRRGELA